MNYLQVKSRVCSHLFIQYHSTWISLHLTIVKTKQLPTFRPGLVQKNTLVSLLPNLSLFFPLQSQYTINRNCLFTVAPCNNITDPNRVLHKQLGFWCLLAGLFLLLFVVFSQQNNKLICNLSSGSNDCKHSRSF